MPEDSTYTLTAAGWPRPRSGGLPVPWVAPAEALGEMNEGRRLATVGGAICNVCGEGFPALGDAFGFTAFTFDGVDQETLPLEFGTSVAELPEINPQDHVEFLDGAVMHWRCARLAATLCPHIAKRNDLVCLRVPANDANPRMVDEKLTLTYSVLDCDYAPWPTTMPIYP